jgi:hypothetical protein
MTKIQIKDSLRKLFNNDCITIKIVWDRKKQEAHLKVNHQTSMEELYSILGVVETAIESKLPIIPQPEVPFYIR